MSVNGTTRPPAEVHLGNRARLAAATLARHERHAARHRLLADEARAALHLHHAAARARLGVDLPLDPFLLDIVDSIEVQPGGRWIWHGLRNNKNLPTVRVSGGHELSVTRLLAVALGVIGDTDYGSLYPTNGDTEDINPFHRNFRRSPTPTGNPARYDTQEAVA